MYEKIWCLGFFFKPKWVFLTCLFRHKTCCEWRPVYRRQALTAAEKKGWEQGKPFFEKINYYSNLIYSKKLVHVDLN